MPLSEIKLELDQSISSDIHDFLAQADQRCDEFFDTGANKTLPRFLPANYHLVALALEELKREHPLLGLRFCEWGSGLGTATCLAAKLGFDAWGVEIEGELVKRARALATAAKLPATFLETSLLPDGFDFLQTQGGMELLSPQSSATGELSYPESDWTLDEVDLFYSYPWPEEQEATLALFEKVACAGAYLLCYFGDDELCAYAKLDHS